MSGRALRLDDSSFWFLIVGAGLCWSVAFPVIALFYQLELYGDGAMFSYAVAVRDVWAFHWHNISGRTSVFLLTLLPAEVVVGITSNPWAGIIAYGLLFYISPLVGLAVSYAADRSPDRIIFVYACGSTALLCPLIFGFPTEMWLAHAIFWPALALSHYAKPTSAGALLVFTAWLLLAFTHEGALVLLLAIAATLAPRGLRSATFVRAAISLMIIVILAVVAKIVLPPDDYYADAFLRAALHFFDLEIFKVRGRPGLAGGDHRLRCDPDAAVNMVPEMGVHLRSGNLARIAIHLLASFRSFSPCEQPLLFANRAGHRLAPVRGVGGLDRHDQRRNRPQSSSEAAARLDDLAPWRDAVRPRLDLSHRDLDPYERNQEVRHVVE